MSALNFIVDVSQEGHLGTHDEQIAELQSIVYNLHKWVQYLDDKVNQYAVAAQVGKKEDHDWIIKKIPGSKDQYFVETGSPPERVLAVYGINKESWHERNE